MRHGATEVGLGGGGHKRCRRLFAVFIERAVHGVSPTGASRLGGVYFCMACVVWFGGWVGGWV